MTREGRSAFSLTVISCALFGVWLAYVGATDIRRPTFDSDPLNAALILGMVGTAILGALAGLKAFLFYSERSPIIGVSILLGGAASYWTFLEIFGR